MNEIRCPHCHTVFSVNESEYAQLLHQVRTVEFDREIVERIEAEKKIFKEQANFTLEKETNKKNQEIEHLKSQLERIEKEQQSQMELLLSQKDNDLTQLKKDIEQLKIENELEISKLLSDKDRENQELKTQLNQIEIVKDREKEKELSFLKQEKNDIEKKLLLQEQKEVLDKQSLINQYQSELSQKDELIAYYRDFKAKQSTKMIGESLEQHCESEFNKLRMTAFPNAQFGKDNDVKTGSKGDYIYREFDENGVEIISIMFEMKNEADETVSKKRNEHFFKELDKDRNEKKCEYAILVSLLESDSELYNNGIVDVSYEYSKMYVVRPQFFIPIITLLRNAALQSLKYKQELALVQEQHIDITHFEEDLDIFKKAFAKNYQSASKNFQKAIDEIDKAIKRMEAIKSALTTSENQLRLANNKLEDVSVKKLTRQNPTMRDKFEQLKNKPAT